MKERSETKTQGDAGKAENGVVQDRVPSWKAAGREFSRHHALSVEIAVAVIAPALAGHWLDTRTGKEPWFTIAGFILGVGAAFRSVQRAYHASQRDLENGRDSAKPKGSEASE